MKYALVSFALGTVFLSGWWMRGNPEPGESAAPDRGPRPAPAPVAQHERTIAPDSNRVGDEPKKDAGEASTPRPAVTPEVLETISFDALADGFDEALQLTAAATVLLGIQTDEAAVGNALLARIESAVRAIEARAVVIGEPTAEDGEIFQVQVSLPAFPAEGETMRRECAFESERILGASRVENLMARLENSGRLSRFGEMMKFILLREREDGEGIEIQQIIRSLPEGPFYGRRRQYVPSSKISYAFRHLVPDDLLDTP